ncbi:amidase family protein [Labrys monachus]|uniref:Indoleacetamide hydrolase n=1 Tax=Labrys monachus TaxID=217067 RepID=A0ABU0FPH9_9HYPH|nr:amidase family protein [Labrys monachus]MDQ0396522.1 aspartyl-tRNA(Asn)/glutamyl-tRNA(Gln) amidotransferase subunit A [Labrys monachus]
MADIEDISRRTAVEIGLAFRNGETTPPALADYLLGRIEASRGDNVFITVTAARAMREAEAAAARYERGRPLSPLDGVPIAWKDLIDIEGAPTTGGSLLFSREVPKTRDQQSAANAAAAGMVCLGKLNLSELAFSGLGLNPHFGTPVNPNDRGTHRAPGGSSSGSGAAVAGGLAPCAIGTDTGGSVRIPAAFNGIVGFKTSEGRLDKTGVIPLSRTLDTLGPLGRSVADCAVLDMVLRGAVTVEARRRDLRDLTLLVPTNHVCDQAEPAVLANFEQALEALARGGATIVRDKVDALDAIAEMTARHGTLTAAEAYFEYRDAVESEKGGAMDRRVRHRILSGRQMSAHDLVSIGRIREKAIADVEARLGGALLVMPTTPVTAPEVAPLDADDALFHEVNLRTLRNTWLGNNLRLCGLAMPNGRDHRGLPTSILFSATNGEDDRLLGFGLEIERALQGLFEPLGRGA